MLCGLSYQRGAANPARKPPKGLFDLYSGSSGPGVLVTYQSPGGIYQDSTLLFPNLFCSIQAALKYNRPVYHEAVL